MCRMHVRNAAELANMTGESQRHLDPQQRTCANETTIRGSLVGGTGGYQVRRSSALLCAQVPPCAQPSSDAWTRMASAPTPIGRARPKKTRTKGGHTQPPHPARNRSSTALKPRKPHEYWIFFASLRPNRRPSCFNERSTMRLQIWCGLSIPTTPGGRPPTRSGTPF